MCVVWICLCVIEMVHLWSATCSIQSDSEEKHGIRNLIVVYDHKIKFLHWLKGATIPCRYILACTHPKKGYTKKYEGLESIAFNMCVWHVYWLSMPLELRSIVIGWEQVPRLKTIQLKWTYFYGLVTKVTIICGPGWRVICHYIGSKHIWFLLHMI